MAEKTTKPNKKPITWPMSEPVHAPEPAERPEQAHPKRLTWLERRIPWLLIGSGVLGLAASFMLAVEEFFYIKNPTSPLNCDINPIITCGPSLDTWQGHVILGIPNQFFGIVTFTALLTVGVALLAGARMKRWFWFGLQAGMLAGVLFVHWFIYQSLYVLGHLCPYCMVTWVATIVGFWYVLLCGIRAGHLKLRGKWRRLNTFVQEHHADILALWFLILIVAILQRFWYYFGSFLS